MNTKALLEPMGSWAWWRLWFLIFLGCSVMGAGFVLFVNPYKFVPGGVYGMGIVLHNIFPIFAGFRGGKGVATLVGAVTGIYPPVALLCFGVWLVILMVSHYVSLASMVAGCCFPVFTLISPKVNGSTAFVVFSFVIAILLIYTHRKNIERLKAGTESKTFIWKPRRVKLDDEERKKSGKEHDRE